ncbi:MAG: pitrilysin family protein [Gammaproteobacteria bacterium]
MQKGKSIHWLFIGLVLCVSAISVQADDGSVHEYTLKNGLKLIVKEDHRAPVMVSQVWYKVGSSYEHDGITGLSHVLEHMMFKGTTAHPAGEFSRIISENGGRENAFTSRDYTAYFQTMEKSRLPVSFELEADRMRNLLIPEEEFQKEVRVVMEERRMRTEDNPQALLYEQFNAMAFMSSPSRIPIIGWMDDLENMQVADLRAWYQQWYAPNNATVVVVGDVDPDFVLTQAKKYFADLKPMEITPPKPRREVRQRGTRYLTVEAPAELPFLIMGYKTPILLTAEESWEPYALDVLAGMLDGGDSARLSSQLVRGQQVAASAGAGYDLHDRLDGLFLMEGTPANGHSIDELKTALLEQIKQLQEKAVTAEELSRIKAQIRATEVYQRDSVFYQAMQIGTLETVGIGWKELDNYMQQVQKVTAEQVQSVAKKYLLHDQLTIAELKPLPIDSENPPRSSAGGSHAH